MCKIIKIKYVSPSGRRRTTERQELCNRSDGTTPCRYSEVSEVTELVSSGTPSLVGDDVSTPVSTGTPGTPLLSTAGANYHYTYREPHDIDRGEGTSKDKKRSSKFIPYLDLSGKSSRKSSSPTSPPRPKHRSERGSKSGSSNGDGDSIIGIEEDGRFSPISPRSPRFGPSLGLPSMRRPRDRETPVVSQPQPPSSSSYRRASTPAPPSMHRRNLTAPDAQNVRFSSSADTELQDRADAREALRRENRERSRREDLRADAAKYRQEADDRKLAEALDAEEREKREKAADEFSFREYQRLQEKDRKRRERGSVVLEQDDASSESPSSTTANIDELEKEISQMKIEAEKRKKDRELADAVERAERNAKRIRDQDAKIEYRLQEELTRINRQAEHSNAMQLLQVQAEIDRLESELAKQKEKRAARSRAEQITQELKHEDLLEEEIRELEDEQNRERELRRIESMMGQRAYDRQRYIAPTPPTYQPTGQAYPPAPMPPSSQGLVHRRDNSGSMSPYESPEYRRARGEQVLEQERARAAAATGGLQRAIAGPGVSRRNTIGGQGRSRDQVYRDLRRQYPG